MSTRPARDTHEREMPFPSSLHPSLCVPLSLSLSLSLPLTFCLFSSQCHLLLLSLAIHSLPSHLFLFSLCLFNLWLKSNLITGRDASPSLTSFRAPDVFHEKKVFLLSIPSPVTLVVFLFSLSLGSRSKV